MILFPLKKLLQNKLIVLIRTDTHETVPIRRVLTVRDSCLNLNWVEKLTWLMDEASSLRSEAVPPCLQSPSPPLHFVFNLSSQVNRCSISFSLSLSLSLCSTHPPQTHTHTHAWSLTAHEWANVAAMWFSEMFPAELMWTWGECSIQSIFIYPVLMLKL